MSNRLPDPRLIPVRNISDLVGVCPVLVFGSVRGVGEGFVASLVLADVRFLSGVRAQVGFQVFEARVRLCTALKLHGNREGMEIIRFFLLVQTK